MKRAVVLIVLTAFVLTVAPSAGFSQAKKQPPPPPPPPKEAGTAKKAEPVDLNSATKDQLVALPGIGATVAQKIIDNRPFKSTSELVSKKLISQATYARLKGLIVANQEKK